MVPLRREKGIAAAVIGIATAAILSPDASARQSVPPAPQLEASGAHTFCAGTSGYCGAAGRTNQLIADGAAARFDYVGGYVAPDWNHSTPGHTNQTLWVSVNNDPNQFCEVGWTKAAFGPETYPYWGFKESGQPPQAYPLYFGLGSPGTSHHWQIVRQYDGLYNVYIDLQDVADCFMDPFTLEIDVGLEYTSESGAVAPANEPRDLQYRDINLNWHFWGEQGSTQDVKVGSRSRWNWVTDPTHGKDWIAN